MNDAVQKRLDQIRAVAKDCGYAIGVHGSERRDLDLIAVPWTPEAVSADQLVTRLCEEVGLRERYCNIYPDGRTTPNPEPKPWGRWAYSLDGMPAPLQYLDLSVAPRAGEPVPLLTFAGALGLAESLGWIKPTQNQMT